MLIIKASLLPQFSPTLFSQLSRCLPGTDSAVLIMVSARNRNIVPIIEKYRLQSEHSQFWEK